ncbi:MAG: four helix bundle protein [Candidatus Sumerlaeota bacterium]|nr:four helix bundle protein [Candidatus Sumerlaeota bacterium]
MSGLERFEDIEGWKKARELAKNIYHATASGNFSKDFGLRDQIRRASVSIMSNIAEGFDRGGNKEFLNFLAMSKGSVGEVKSQLYIAMDVGYITEDEFQKLYSLASEVSKLIGGFIRYLQQSDMRGSSRKANL